MAYPFLWGTPWVLWALAKLRPGTGAAVLIPSSLLRYLTFKLTWDLQQIPALHELARAALRLLLNGDTSQWDRAIQMPHYNTRSMPAISLHTGMHLIQARPARVVHPCALPLPVCVLPADSVASDLSDSFPEQALTWKEFCRMACIICVCPGMMGQSE